ncbi:flagellar biosynthesis protein FlhA [Anaerocolumna aminovalerica]|jgi:flagellar biosynthesis protein FlhA|uniref:Flagellar biosynthesis protein FlhA n=1 Tax=Anaerocolumna aminovalerica TaxID=1527 RepID=A0A1I5I610_9FIRM|nr:flagellar biosynthesis protein FlhA [Anaerocolumna aminovalerica]MBU5333378.1 flagellar biosynthesis protein FlhA [Anaerocolumna aminovalerica]MDU6263860.1 flagellar biosynthesis protein FlhA [Anaerocolumna aminovalerica]SFO55511.1 flagellar biosynthesis protein FlhA [Anaerocolumna aminovalerica]
MRKTDLAIGLYILAAIVFLIVPLPSVILDVLLAFNLAVSMVILFNALFSREVLNMSTFPTILLFTTVFRISLNVSSTRLILQNGNPGNVVRTFGEFVGGGDGILGIIVFIILLLVQFMVINKGSERVAEVTARFTLDAMPGKQMAIDADLNTGAINDTQARERREKIQEESNFFGSMDGATKYVKGDAIAGLIITVINLAGGMIMEMMRNGTAAGDAFNMYSVLTIGNGLVNQIPSLMISLATGILVTKVSKDADIGDLLVKQLFSIPKVLYIVGGSLIFLGIATPLNTIVFTTYGVIFIVTGRVIAGKMEVHSIEEQVALEEDSTDEIRKPENVNTLLQVDPIELEFGYGIIPLADVNQGGDLLDRVVLIRRQIALELGCVVPIIRLRDNIQLNPNQYVIKIKGIAVSEGEILFDHYMAMNPGYVEDEISGIPTFEPSFHLPALWITESQRERAESLGYTVVDPPSIIATHLTEVIRSHIHELLTRQDVQNLINNVQEANSTLITELVPKLLGVGEIQKVLQNLLKEGISIRDLITVFETLADYASTTRDTDVLTEYVRQSLKRAISNKYFPPKETTSVVTLDPKIEQEIMGSIKQTEQGAYITLDPEKTQDIIHSVEEEIQKLENLGKNPIVITSPIVRMYFKKLTQDYFKDLIVISYNEIESNVELQSVGMVTA